MIDLLRWVSVNIYQPKKIASTTTTTTTIKTTASTKRHKATKTKREATTR